MFRIGIVGSGPAAFYTAQKLLKSSQKVQIDMFEKLPIPFGLIRYGVAPDHPEVKNVINTFTQVARHKNFRFFGNVNVGQDLRVNELRKLYHSIVLAYGAAQDRKLEIPGEDLKQVYSAIDLVGWYNGLPEKENFRPDLHGEDAVIIGHGNVALDIARILLCPIDLLKKTDTPDYVLSQLVGSKIRTIHLVGRRGPVQAAFTIKEFRELVNLQNVNSEILIPEECSLSSDQIEKLPRPKKRMMNLMLDTIKKTTSPLNSMDKFTSKHMQMHFLRSPQFISDIGTDGGNVNFVRFNINHLQGDAIVTSKETVDIPCQMVVRSIGYRSLKIDPDIPFDTKQNIIPNKNGRVIEESTNVRSQSSLYCVGWIKIGPVGVILNTLVDAQETSTSILEDIEGVDPRSIVDDVSDVLKTKGIKFLSFENWEALDLIETSLGQTKGKPREKLTNIHDIMMALTRNKDGK